MKQINSTEHGTEWLKTLLNNDQALINAVKNLLQVQACTNQIGGRRRVIKARRQTEMQWATHFN